MQVNVLTPEVLELLRQLGDSIKDLSEARTMPGGVYTSEEFFRFETEAIFAREWLCLGHHSEIPNPGDYVTIKIGSEPLIVVRGDDGSVSVLSGICQHRGFPLTADEPSGNTTRFRCPYHFWSYGRDGSLISAPEMHRTVDLQTLRAETCLPSLKVELWHGLIFANMDPDAAPLAPTLTKLDAEIENFDLEHLVAMPAIDYPDRPWNWKGMHENALEPYHTSFVHRGYHEVAPASQAEFVTWDDDDGQVMHPTYFKHIDGALNPTLKTMLPALPGLTETQRRRVMFASIMPVVFLALMPDQVFLFLVLPQSAGKMTLRIMWLFPRSTLEVPNFDWIYASQTGSNDVLNQQDMMTNERMQQGQHSRFAPRGRYSWQEGTLPQMNRWLYKRYQAFCQEAGLAEAAGMANADTIALDPPHTPVGVS
jgi:phenylpropionate dioxygenase-like ring-hydroxylating dioxygenase large terminal subunit